MKKMLAALALALTLPTCALGDSEGVIVQSSCNIVQSGDYYLAYCFAQVHNNASTVICLDQGTFDLQSGETLLSTSEVSQIWPYFSIIHCSFFMSFISNIYPPQHNMVS